MRPLLLIVSLLALLVTLVPGDKASTAGLPHTRAASGPRQKSDGIAAIEAYCKGLDQYFKSHPKSTRFFVDALPEGQADTSPEAKRKWYEVKSMDEMLDAERGYANHSIIVSMKDGDIVYVDIAEPREHSRHDDSYYFRRDGSLAKIASDFQSNMQEANISRESFYNSNGKLLRATAQCFHITPTSNGSRQKRVSCKRSEMSAEIEDYQIPVYKRNTSLPGYDLLKKQ